MYRQNIFRKLVDVISVWCLSVSTTFLLSITLLKEIQFKIKYIILIFRYMFAWLIVYHRSLNTFMSLGIFSNIFSILIRLLGNSFWLQ